MNMPNDDYWVNLSEDKKKDAAFRKAKAHVVMRVDGKYGILAFTKSPQRVVVFDTRADAYHAAEQLNTVNELAVAVERPIRGFS